PKQKTLGSKGRTFIRSCRTYSYVSGRFIFYQQKSYQIKNVPLLRSAKKTTHQLCSESELNEIRNGMTGVMPFL
ncbi:MAG TPA: hypothetical protein H9810_04040, partial [Candidatus Gemmiger excrementavium]|nr:hypothetical protein [Candidatus Gemmiger excrementavium]